MEQPEVPLESVQEHIEHHAHLSTEKWISLVALSTAIFAALAAISSLLAGDHVNEAMITRIQSSDQWAYYQAKGIKSSVLESRVEMLQAIGKTPVQADVDKISEYAHEQAEIKKEAEEKAAESSHHLRKHVILARSVTMFQIAIAMSAISVLTKRRWFWVVSIVFGALGVIFLVEGFVIA